MAEPPVRIKKERMEHMTILHANLSTDEEREEERGQGVPQTCEYCDMKFTESGNPGRLT